MVFDRETIEALEKFHPAPWTGNVFRHMFADFPPERENRLGARWNPRDVPAIYTSLHRETALAEAEYYISLQPVRPSAPRKMHRMAVALNSVLDLTDWTMLESLGLQKSVFAFHGSTDSQMIGGAAEWLGNDGILVPSARDPGFNLVIFPNKQRPGYLFDSLDAEAI